MSTSDLAVANTSECTWPRGSLRASSAPSSLTIALESFPLFGVELGDIMFDVQDPNVPFGKSLLVIRKGGKIKLLRNFEVAQLSVADG